MWILFWEKRSVIPDFSDIKGLLDRLHVAFYPRINIQLQSEEDDDDALSWGTINILAWTVADTSFRYVFNLILFCMGLEPWIAIETESKSGNISPSFSSISSPKEIKSHTTNNYKTTAKRYGLLCSFANLLRRRTAWQHCDC